MHAAYSKAAAARRARLIIPAACRAIDLDFQNESRRNDGSPGSFAAGNKVDDLFFLVEPAGAEPVELLVDEVVLYDAGVTR